jgi:hypothetical protein
MVGIKARKSGLPLQPLQKQYQFQSRCGCTSVNKRTIPMTPRISRTTKCTPTKNLPAPANSWFVLGRVVRLAEGPPYEGTRRQWKASESPPILLSEYENTQNEPICRPSLPPFDSAQGEVNCARSAKNRFTCVILAKTSPRRSGPLGGPDSCQERSGLLTYKKFPLTKTLPLPTKTLRHNHQ